MARLPPGFSTQATPISAALSEGRNADARRLLAELLRAGKADRVVQRIAADLILPPKRVRGRPSTLPLRWYEIAEYYHRQRQEGTKREVALRLTAEQFVVSETHVRNCIETYEEGLEAGRES